MDRKTAIEILKDMYDRLELSLYAYKMEDIHEALKIAIDSLEHKRDVSMMFDMEGDDGR